MRIWKFELPRDGCKIEMPRGARVLSVQFQRGDLCVWALVDPKAPKVMRQFRIFGTGWDCPDDPGLHIATVQEGEFVWHVFEA